MNGIVSTSFAGHSRLALALVVLVALCAAGCNGSTRSSVADQERAARAEAAVVGTVVDAATGERLSGARIEGPHGTRAVSGRDGRFELRGLHAQDSGKLSARLDDGRVAVIELRPLKAGKLDVVLHMRKP